MSGNGEYLRCRVISTAHLSADDNALLDEITTREVEYGEWIHYVGGGYLLRLTARSAPVLRLKEAGFIERGPPPDRFRDAFGRRVSPDFRIRGSGS